ncbi:MAG: amidohydrolase [Synergistaceae bacterium]|jgi:5-methylthioadenosine/S-adenosylhomocysteine deaminase|nr:amidohydrolase [Synergistaceae bacterium]
MPAIRDVLIWDSERGDAERGDIAIGEDGRISDICPPRSAKRDILFDGRGEAAAIPGLVNSHTHVSMTMLRGLAEELPLMEWLQKKIFPVEERLLPRHIRSGAELALLEMIEGGTTCFADMYYFMREVASAALSFGMRAALCRGLTGDDSQKINENLNLAEEFGGREGRIIIQLGPHAPYTVPRDALARIAGIARDKNLGIHFHWLETEGELEKFKEKYGKENVSPSDYLEGTGLLDAPKLLLAHCVWHPVDELERLCRPNVTLVHNPKSNLKLGSGYAPLREMLKSGANVALGTDGAASNNKLDMWDEMRSAALMHKGYHKDPTLVSARDVLRMSTLSGAAGMGFGDVGLIKKGWQADLVIVDISGPRYVGCGESNLPEFLVYAGDASDVRATIVAGKLLYKNGRHLTADRDEVVAKAREHRQEIMK